MTVFELDARLEVLRREATEIRDRIAGDDPSVEMAVALGALSAVVVILESLLPKKS